MTSWSQSCFPEAVIGSILFHWLWLVEEERAGGYVDFARPLALCSQYFPYRGSCVQSTISSFQYCLLKQPKSPASHERKSLLLGLSEFMKVIPFIFYWSFQFKSYGHLPYILINNLCWCRTFLVLALMDIILCFLFYFYLWLWSFKQLDQFVHWHLGKC